MNEIDLRLTIEEANLVLEALGNLPFVRVYALIGKIQTQASEQVMGQSALKSTALNGHPQSVPLNGIQHAP